MGECRACARWTVDQQDDRWGTCGLPDATSPRMVHVSVLGTPQILNTRAMFGCKMFQPKPPPESAAPDWQALAARRGAALEQAWQTIHQAAYVLPRAERWLPEARDSLAVVWEDVAREVAAARDAVPEAR